MKRLAAGVAACSIAWPFGITASAQDAPRPVTNLITAALQNNPDLRAARAQVTAAEGELLRSEVLAPNPELSLDYASDALLDASGESRASIGLTQELQIGGQRGLRKSVARLRLEAARAQWRNVALQIARDGAEAWLNVQRARGLADVNRQAAALGDSLATAAQRRQKAGDIAELERNVVEVDALRARATLAVSEAEVARAEANLTRFLGSPVPEVPMVLDVVASDIELSAQMELALRQRPDLAAVQLAIEASGDEVTLRRRERIPNPILGLAYDREKFFVSGPLPTAGSVRLEHLSTLLAVRLTFPLPVWQRNQGEIRAALGAQTAAEAQRDSVERQIRAEVASALQSLRSAQVAHDLYQTASPKVARNLALLQKGYQGGEVDLSTLLTARDRSLATQREAIDAQVNLVRALIELRRATGLLPDGRQP
jgi:cobalt-zinc-cadmium efflux system outer membrane protein